MANRRPTQADVARLAQVSQGTVSMVLNQSSSRVRISEETRERVLQAIRVLDYTPNPSAQKLAGGSNRLIGVFTYEDEFPLELENPFHGYLQGIECEAVRQDYDLVLFTRARVASPRSVFAGGPNILSVADGAILLGARTNRSDLVRLCQQGYPFVYIGRREVPQHTIDWVTSDYGGDAAKVVRYLAELGHRRVGVLAKAWVEESLTDALSGCRSAAVQVADMDLHVLPEASAQDTGVFLESVRRLSLTALICVQASGVALRMLREAGIRVPEDVSVVDLVPEAGMDPFGELTMLRLSRTSVGELAMRTLVAGLNETGQGPHQVLVPSELIVGRTTAPPGRHT